MVGLAGNRGNKAFESRNITGVIEVLPAIGIQIPSARTLTAWLLIVFFIVLLPANIKAASQHVDYEKATSAGEGV